MPSACWLSNLSVTLPDSVLASKGHSTEPLLLLLPAAVVNVLTVKDEDLEMSEAGREVVSSDNQLVSCDALFRISWWKCQTVFTKLALTMN